MAAPKDGLLKCVNYPVVGKKCQSPCAEGLKTSDCHRRASPLRVGGEGVHYMWCTPLCTYARGFS